MTQAFNLSQLANKVNTSGNLDASTALYNQVPVANGGTGKSTVTSGALLLGAGTSALTELVGSTPGQAVVWNGTTFTTGSVSGAADGINTYITPGTWTKTAGLLQVKVTVIGSGGGGANIPTAPTTQASSGGGSGGAAIRWIPAPTIPGPVAITAGFGTNSFGAFCSATAGANGVVSTSYSAGGAGGSGTGGTINIAGNRGGMSQPTGLVGGGVAGAGAPSILGTGGAQFFSNGNGIPGTGYGSGGGGANKSTASATGYPGGNGGSGIVIVEEFY
jgi:hypothetical protein